MKTSLYNFLIFGSFCCLVNHITIVVTSRNCHFVGTPVDVGLKLRKPRVAEYDILITCQLRRQKFHGSKLMFTYSCSSRHFLDVLYWSHGAVIETLQLALTN